MVRCLADEDSDSMSEYSTNALNVGAVLEVAVTKLVERASSQVP
jgi:hypothetical protein